MLPQQVVLKLTTFKTQDGLFVAAQDSNYNGRNVLRKDLLINGKSLIPTHHKSWYLVLNETEIKTVEEPFQSKKLPDHYTLKDNSLFVEGKIPTAIPYEEVNGYYDDEGDWVWRNYTTIQYLYTLVYKEFEGGLKEVLFEVLDSGEVEGSISKPLDTKFKIAGKYESDDVERLLKDIVTYSELEQVLTPEFLLHEKPCTLSSKQFYNIIRSYVKDNIDKTQAVVTSDYEFCFAVSKRIEIKPYEIRREQLKTNGKSYRTPKFTSSQIKYEDVRVFEITNKVDKYREYPVLDDIKGESLQDLVDNVKVYLDTLIEKLNKPVKRCDCCNGKGYMLNN